MPFGPHRIGGARDRFLWLHMELRKTQESRYQQSFQLGR